jgi:hypothetical protein
MKARIRKPALTGKIPAGVERGRRRGADFQVVKRSTDDDGKIAIFQ